MSCLSITSHSSLHFLSLAALPATLHRAASSKEKVQLDFSLYFPLGVAGQAGSLTSRMSLSMTSCVPFFCWD